MLGPKRQPETPAGHPARTTNTKQFRKCYIYIYAGDPRRTPQRVQRSRTQRSRVQRSRTVPRRTAPKPRRRTPAGYPNSLRNLRGLAFLLAARRTPPAGHPTHWTLTMSSPMNTGFWRTPIYIHYRGGVYVVGSQDLEGENVRAVPRSPCIILPFAIAHPGKPSCQHPCVSPLPYVDP